jgi:hypothetical protein
MSTPEVRTNGHVVQLVTITNARLVRLERRLAEIVETAKEGNGGK